MNGDGSNVKYMHPKYQDKLLKMNDLVFDAQGNIYVTDCSGTVMADLLGIDIPVFLGIPSLDRCEGIDLVVAEFVKYGKANLTYRNYIHYDHGFFEHMGAADIRGC